MCRLVQSRLLAVVKQLSKNISKQDLLTEIKTLEVTTNVSCSVDDNSIRFCLICELISSYLIVEFISKL